MTARAGNRAMPAGQLWFRIYPVYGGGTHEFPIAEKLIDTLGTNQTVTLSGMFTPPSLDKSVEFLAIIDDGHNFVEIIESNNQLITSFHQTGVRDLSAGESIVSIYPNPASDRVYFSYDLEASCERVSMALFGAGGQLQYRTGEFPAFAGEHQVVHRVDHLRAGSYFYLLEFVQSDGETRKVTGILIKE